MGLVVTNLGRKAGPRSKIAPNALAVPPILSNELAVIFSANNQGLNG